MASLLQRISESSRSRDWRLSLLPFIMGCVYLWIWHFALPWEWRTMLLLLLSLITASGFAALGYFINEFFDQRHDALAGKTNRLASLSMPMQASVLVAAILAAFSPWFWLPADDLSWCLIGSQVGLFLLYSLPFPRLKAVPLVSNLVDMGYAYVVPLMLSFHTYALYADSVRPTWFIALLITVGLVGFRNILIHQVNDVFNDRRAGMRTLPQVLGPRNTSIVLVLLLVIEVVAFWVFGLLLAQEEPLVYGVVALFAAFLALRLLSFREVLSMQFFPLEQTRHLTDPFYQLVFPAMWLIALSIVEPLWTILIIPHTALLIPWPLLKDGYRMVSGAIPPIKAMMWTVFTRLRHWASSAINYPVYWLFRMFGIDLIRERKSAMDFLRSRLSQ